MICRLQQCSQEMVLPEFLRSDLRLLLMQTLFLVTIFAVRELHGWVQRYQRQPDYLVTSRSVTFPSQRQLTERNLDSEFQPGDIKVERGTSYSYLIHVRRDGE